MGFHSPNGGNRCAAVGGGKTFAKSIFSRHSCLSASSCLDLVERLGGGGRHSSCCKISKHLLCLESLSKEFLFASLNKK